MLANLADDYVWSSEFTVIIALYKTVSPVTYLIFVEVRTLCKKALLTFTSFSLGVKVAWAFCTTSRFYCRILDEVLIIEIGRLSDMVVGRF